VIRDYKTGSGIDATGEVRADYALQLRCYGLMLLEQKPRARIRLILDDGVERDVTFDAEAQWEARRAIEEITANAPPPGYAPADSLACVGTSCDGCPFRIVCNTYQQAAPGWWRHYPNGVVRVPFDSFGIITAVSPAGGETSISIEDKAGRSVRIERLDRRHGLDDSLKGDQVWAFNLAASGGGRGFNGVRFHPRGFYELPRDRWERRAWTATIRGAPVG
jgi:hypothetical protein